VAQHVKETLIFTTSDLNHCVEIKYADVSFLACGLETPILEEGDKLADKHFKQDISIGI
jgi:hypothetical protein